MEHMKIVIFNDKQGAGYICTSPDEMQHHVRLMHITVNGEKLIPGQKTTMSGFFFREVEYVGLIGNCEMIFFAGSDDSLFDTKYYYQSINRICDDRIFIMYMHGSGRDYYYKGGKWK